MARRPEIADWRKRCQEFTKQQSYAWHLWVRTSNTTFVLDRTGKGRGYVGGTFGMGENCDYRVQNEFTEAFARFDFKTLFSGGVRFFKLQHKAPVAFDLFGRLRDDVVV